MRTRENDVGNVSVMLVAWIAVFALCMSGIARVAQVVGERSRVQGAADAVALAFVTAGRSVATAVALQNDVVVESSTVASALDGGTARVVVCRGRVCASATAARDSLLGQPATGTR